MTAKQYDPMPEALLKKSVETMEGLFKDLREAGGGEGAPGGVVEQASTGGVSCEGVRVPLEAPLMSQAEADKYTVRFSDTVADNGAGLRSLLEDQGIAIITGCMNTAELEITEAMWKADLLTLAGHTTVSRQPMCVRNAYKKVAEKGVTNWPPSTSLGVKFANVGGLSSGSYAWANRLHPNVKQVFAFAHQEEDLVVGVDNVFFTPKNKPPLRDNEYWLHADQNNHMPNPSGEPIRCYQGVLYTWSSTSPDASTTVVCPGSHKDAYDLMMTDPKSFDQGHYVPHLSSGNPKVKEYLVRLGHSTARRVPVPAGALFLWDSRVSHQGWAGGRRLAMPVCWEPARLRMEDARRRKLWIAAAGVPSTHWATLGIVHSMGPKSLVTEVVPGSDGECPSSAVKLPLYPSIIPFAVDPAKVDQWKQVMPALWKGSSKNSAANFKTPEVVEQLLRPEVLAAL